MLTAHTLNDRICAHSSNAAHAMEIPPNARMLFCNGQVGALPGRYGTHGTRWNKSR